MSQVQLQMRQRHRQKIIRQVAFHKNSQFHSKCILLLILLYISLRQNRHNILLAGSPCFTPYFDMSGAESEQFYLTRDFTAVYIDLRALINCVLIFSFTSLCQSKVLSILSNIFLSQGMQRIISFYTIILNL